MANVPQPVLDQISMKQGDQASTESLIGVSQKASSVKIDLFNQSILLHQIQEEGRNRDIARLRSLGLPHAGDWLSVVPMPALGLHLRPPEFVHCLKYRLGVQAYAADALPALLKLTEWEIMPLDVQNIKSGSPGMINSATSSMRLLPVLLLLQSRKQLISSAVLQLVQVTS